jgi:Pretoxin HINT domain
MISSILLLSVMIAGAPGADAPGPEPKDLASYKAAAAGVGHSADAHVRLALWCEAHGLTAERLKHLALAVLYEPSNVLARGLMGLVAHQGKWERPEQVSQAIENDAARQAQKREYLERRAKAADRAEDQWKLALWCEQNDLKSQATAHLFRVLQLDPSREAAWKHLGYKRIGGRWDKPERVAAAKAEAHAQQKADKHWKPLLEKWREELASRDKTRREQAEAGLAEVTDPRAVPMIWIVLAKGSVLQQKTAVRLLGQIDSPGSSRALALVALSTRSADVRREATQILRRRDPRDFAGVLIALFRNPIKYEVRRVNGPGSQGQLLIKQPDVNVKRLYSPLSEPNVGSMPGDQYVLDSNGLPVLIRNSVYAESFGSALSSGAFFGPNSGPAPIAAALSQAGVPAGLSKRIGGNVAGAGGIPVFNVGPPNGAILDESLLVRRETDIPIGQMALEAQRSAQVAEQQLTSDVQAIDEFNRPIVEMNRRARQVLADSVGIDRGLERLDWEKWFVDLSGYAFAAQSSVEPPTVVEEVPISYEPQASPLIADQPLAVVVTRHSCFGAGTLVRTIDGSSRIENVRSGDLVLTQAPATGELKYQPVLTAYHNPPNATLRIELGGETIVATGIHRFWKANQGWVMARELKPGDALRTLAGVVVVKSVDKEQVQPVFNLQVAEGESFFVGQTGVLAHDNSPVNATPSPFDAVPLPEKSATR